MQLFDFKKHTETKDTKFLPTTSFLALLKQLLQVQLKNSWQQNGNKSDNIIFQHLAI